MKYYQKNIPSRYENQLNGKTAQQNYNTIKANRKKEENNFIFELIKKTLQTTLEKSLYNILKILNK